VKDEYDISRIFITDSFVLWFERLETYFIAMGKIGANEQCPCGSGRKYKKCCMGELSHKSDFVDKASLQHLAQDINDLESLSHSVPTLIKQGRLDDAETACKRLLDEYPEQHDYLHRYAELYAAKGNKTKAIEHYEKTIEYMKTHNGFDADSISWVQDEIDKLNA
jgi:tetratricopeptide (TPR) repeat protein